jgi:hypothetical protein
LAASPIISKFLTTASIYSQLIGLPQMLNIPKLEN